MFDDNTTLTTEGLQAVIAFLVIVVLLLFFFYANSKGERVYIGEATVKHCHIARGSHYIGAVHFDDGQTNSVQMTSCRVGERVTVYKITGLLAATSYYEAL